MNQNSVGPSGSVETLADVPEHILKGLPEEVRLLPSTVDKTRLGVWATKPIFRGRKFGPFVGDKKKRSQVKSNVYMWEVYYPNLGWMCVDATDPAKGSWLRYVNWARSGKEQNLFPLEINRTIYYKTLKPIEPGDELLVWYNGEEDPGIAAALEEERASHRGRRSSPKAKRGKKKSQEAKSKGKKARDKKRKAPLGLDLTPFDMRETKEGHKPEEEAPAVSAVLPLDQAAVIQEMVNHNALPHLLVSSPASEPPASPEDKPEGLVCGPKDRGEDPEEEEEEEEAEEEEEELVEEMEEEEEEEPEEEEEGSLSKEIPEVESTSAGEDKLESAEEQSSLSEDSPGSSPKKKPSVKFPKARGESNGGVPGASMFPCQHCERKFTTKQGLERHVHIHISAISHAFKCRYCGKAFGTQINRRRHERRHEAGPKRKLLLPSASAQPSGGSAQAAEGGAQSDAKVRQEAPEAEKAPSKTPHPPSSEESREPKESHPCQYCRKVFGTHTNMRRHQRRVHERHLIPKGVRRKPEEPQAPAGQAQHPSSAYVASTDLEEEGEADDTYAMGVSSNITENLNYYIDGKIQSSSSTSNCDMIEVESGSAEVFGINCLLSPVAVEISPNVKAVPVRLVEGSKEPPGGGHPEAKRRRTASPPLLAKIKTETEAEPIASLCSLTIPLAISTVESLPFPKEKSIYLSSKLKQLLQTQDNNKAAPSPPSSSSGDVPKLGLPAASSPLLPATSSRFKRRTSSPQHSPGLRDPGKASEGQPAWSEAALGSKLPKLERRSNSPAWSSSGREDREATSPLRSEERPASKEWTPSPPFGNVCNQQPLDLSSSVKQRSNGKGSAQGPWESVLDLSVHKKPGGDGEGKEAPSTPPAGGAVRKKPTTSMLQKVLLNEYNGTSLAPESLSPDTGPGPKACKLPEAPSLPGSAPPAPAVELGCPGLATETPLPPAPACQAPSVLARTASPSHPPCPPMLKVPTPPPPLLPTVGSPLPEDPVSTPPSPCPSPLSNATAPSPLPILSPTVSASPVRSVEPLGCASPGPPTLSPSSSSSSSSSSSFSSSSSSTSPSSSPSPPPLSLVSSVLSPGENLENSAPLVAFKQEEDEHRCQKPREDPHRSSAADALQEPFSKRFVCNVCEAPFLAIKDLTKHLCVHAGEWPFKCEFCVQLFREKAGLSEHRFLLHGVGNIFVCSVCKKEFAFLCNLQQHQRDLHPDKECTHHQFESGILRPQNFTDPSKANAEQMQSLPHVALESSKEEEGGEEGEEGEEGGPNDSSEELYTTIKIMAAGVKPKDPDVRMGLNQHYPSFKPPPFQYHHRNPNGIGATATNFTTHNIPQTFSTAIRCTKCGKSVDNMPELHKHILACASASDKKRYTPKKNPVPLKQVVHPKNGVVLPGPANHSFRRVGQPKRLDFGVEVSRTASDKLKLSALKKKNQLVQKAILQKKRSQQRAELRNSSVAPSAHICPYCGREFTYIGSLNKHASYSCPQKPLSSSSKKKAKKKSGASPPGSNKSGANPRRRTADAEIKMQGAHAHLGKTRARSSGPAAAQPPPAPLKLKQSVKFVHPVKSKKPPPLPAARNVGPARGGKAVPPEGKRSQGVPKGGPPGLLSKASRKLHVRIRRSQAALASKKKADRFGARSSRERVGGPVTRSLQHATFAEAAESKREESLARPELKDFRNLL